MRNALVLLLLLPIALTAQNKVGINTNSPTFKLDIRGTDNGTDGGDLQVATPSETNFLRLSSGTLGDRQASLAFHSSDTFQLISALPDWSIANNRLTIVPNGNIGLCNKAPKSILDIRGIGHEVELLRFTTERPWVIKQWGTENSALALQTLTNLSSFKILSEDGSNRAAEFITGNSGSSVLLVPDAGNIGAGVDEPLGKLHIQHNSGLSSPQLRLTETGGADYARIKMEGAVAPGVYWDIAGSTDTSLTDSRLNFYYSGPEGFGDRLTILGNGKIGLGKFSPEAQLDIYGGDWNLAANQPGDLRIGAGYESFRIGVKNSGGNAGTTYMFAFGGPMYLGTNSAIRLTVAESGNIGIGTISPTSKLHLQGGHINIDNLGVALRVHNDELVWYNGTYFSWGFGGAYNYFDDEIKIGGISSETPVSKLHIQEDAGDASLTLEGTGDAYIQFTDDATPGSTFQWTLRRDDSDGGKMQWRYNDAPHVTYTTDGKVYIGSTNDGSTGARLYVKNDLTGVQQGAIYGESSTYIGVHGVTNGSNVVGSSRGVYGLATATTGTNYGVFGRTFSPDGYAGYFDGRVHSTDDVVIEGSLTVDDVPFGDYANLQYRTATGQFYYDNSSRRYKENIKTLQTDFARILNARPVQYTRPGAPDRIEIGYIAEEMEALGLDHLIGYDEDGLVENFNYEKMIVYVVEVVKDQQTTIQAQSQVIADQQNALQEQQQAIASLQDQFEALKTLVGSAQGTNDPENTTANLSQVTSQAQN